MPSVKWYLQLPVFLTVLAGCATWTSAPTESENLLRKTRLSVDSVILEIIFVQTDPTDEDWSQSLWSQIDEAKLDSQQRRRLLENGIRCGIVGVQIPELIRGLIRPQPADDDLESAWTSGLPTDRTSTSRRLQARAGQRTEIVTAEIEASMVVLVNEDGVVSGNTYGNAQTILAAQAEPLGDGLIEITLVPEIHHGEPRQKWVGREGSFVLEVGKQRKSYSQLKITTTLAPGETVAITSDSKRQSLGSQFFGDSGRDGSMQKMLLIRLAHSRDDELFTAGEQSDISVTGQ